MYFTLFFHKLCTLQTWKIVINLLFHFNIYSVQIMEKVTRQKYMKRVFLYFWIVMKILYLRQMQNII